MAAPLSTTDAEVQSVLNRLAIFAQNSLTERADCAKLLHTVAESEELLVKGVRALQKSTVTAVGIELCSTINSVAESKDWVGWAQVLDAMFLLLANCCLSDDLTCHLTLLELPLKSTSMSNDGEELNPFACAVGKLLNSADQPQLPGTTIFAAFDLVATIAANSSAVRTALGRAGIMSAVLFAMKSRKVDLDVLYGGTMCFSTLTMADTVNGKRLVEAGGVQVLLDIYKYCSMKGPTMSAEPAANSGGNLSTSQRETAKSIAKNCEQSLMNLMKVPFDCLDEAIGKANFGKYGAVVAMDELQWNLKQERKRCQQLLAAFREEKKKRDAAAGVAMATS